MIPITRLSVGQQEADAAAEAILSGWLTTGPRVQKFEAAVAEYVGTKHAVAVNSCTTALHLALVAAGVSPGDEVICPSFSFIATANAIVHAGARPVFVDIDPRTYNVDPAAVEAAVTAYTTAIVPVSQIGLAADIPAIRAIADRHNLRVVEDAAPSLGATLGGRKVGSLSDLTCFSFDARKILTTGEGGMITTDDDRMAARMRALRAHAASVSADARHNASAITFESYPEAGCNYKMTDMQGAIGLVQMTRLDAIIAERRRLAGRYRDLLGNDPRLELPWEPQGSRHVYQSYCVRLRKDFKQLDVMNGLNAAGVSTRRVMAIHVEPAYREWNPDLVLPATEEATTQTILLPMFVGLADQEQDQVAAALRETLDRLEPSASRMATKNVAAAGALS